MDNLQDVEEIKVEKPLDKESDSKPKRRGRPPKSESNGAKNAKRATTANKVEIDSSLVKSVVKHGYSMLDSLVSKRVGEAVFKMTDNDKVAKQFYDEMRMSNEEKENLVETTCIVLEKYHATAYTPEIGLVIALGAYSLRVSSTLSDINKMQNELRVVNEHQAKS